MRSVHSFEKKKKNYDSNEKRNILYGSEVVHLSIIFKVFSWIFTHNISNEFVSKLDYQIHPKDI